MNRLLRRDEVREASRPGARVTAKDNTLGGHRCLAPGALGGHGLQTGGDGVVDNREFAVDRFFLDERYILGVTIPGTTRSRRWPDVV
jgi:hypothetical protein